MLVRYVVGPVLERVTLWSEHSLFPENRFVFQVISVFFLFSLFTNQFKTKKHLWRVFWISTAFGIIVCHHNIIENIHFVRKPKTLLLHEGYVLVLVLGNFVFNYFTFRFLALLSIIQPFNKNLSSYLENLITAINRNIILFAGVYLIYLGFHKIIVWDFYSLSQYIDDNLFENTKEVASSLSRNLAILANGVILLMICTKQFTNEKNLWKLFWLSSVFILVLSIIFEFYGLQKDFSNLQLIYFGIYYSICLLIANYLFLFVFMKTLSILKVKVYRNEISN